MKGRSATMKRTRLTFTVLVLTASVLLAGCGGGSGTPTNTETPVGLTQAKKDELSAKYKAEAKKITKENAEEVARDLEAQINADASK
jgi:hypothetical protein